MSARTAVQGVVRLAGPRLPLVSFLARLPAALCPTGTLLMVTALDGVGRGGVVAGLLWGGQAVGGPLLGRLADRRGHRPVILAASLANALLTAALVVASVGALAPAVQAGCAALAGFTVPQIGPLSRTRWIALAGGRRDGHELVGPALAFDAVVDETSFVAGPALVGVLAWAVHPAAGLVCAAVLMAVFGTVFALHPTAPAPAPAVAAAAPTAAGRTAAAGRVLSGPLLVLIAVTVLQGVVFGAANTGVQYLARGDAGVGGLVWSAMGVSSAAAGVLLASFAERFDLTARLRTAVAAQAVLLLGLLPVDGVAGAAVAVGAVGFAVAPALIAVFGLVERVAPAGRMAEAMTLLGSGLIAGQGLAVTGVGPLVGAHGPLAAFAPACAAGALALLLVLALVRLRRFPPARPAPAPALAAAAASS
ncbi:MFS transporter [Kitasatospora sp. NPDC059088]|uniref:MFS transporter n=1 Tax=Kitasatospora sp. NPDC059088 TaxID=3346722 RepID=UPI0036C3E2EF